jgi:hypothetical protein
MEQGGENSVAREHERIQIANKAWGQLDAYYKTFRDLEPSLNHEF